MVKDNAMPLRLKQGSTEIGIANPVKYRTFDPTTATPEKALGAGLAAGVGAGGTPDGHAVVQEDLAKAGIDWRQANPVQWIKAIGELNYRFTNRVSNMYRAAAMLDYSAKATKRGYFLDPTTGEKIAMTAERAQFEGIQHALKVMGDLKSMTPLERSTFMRIMPFYGWTRHILQYVGTYPVDHPYRARS